MLLLLSSLLSVPPWWLGFVRYGPMAEDEMDITFVTEVTKEKQRRIDAFRKRAAEVNPPRNKP